MNEEELFCKMFPEYTVNGKPLSPYFDLFESGFEQAENHIEELEKEVERITVKYNNCAKDNYKKTSKFEKEIAELEKENAELKEQLRFAKEMPYSAVKKFAEEKTQDQLTKAKEIIKKFSEFVNNEVEYDPEHPQEHTDLWNKLCEEAEQFLSEVEK